MELLLLGEDCSPQQLSEWGLINRVVSGMEALDATVASMAAKIAAQPEFPTSSVKMQFRSIASNWSAPTRQPHKTALLWVRCLLGSGTRVTSRRRMATRRSSRRYNGRLATVRDHRSSERDMRFTV